MELLAPSCPEPVSLDTQTEGQSAPGSLMPWWHTQSHTHTHTHTYALKRGTFLKKKKKEKKKDRKPWHVKCTWFDHIYCTQYRGRTRYHLSVSFKNDWFLNFFIRGRCIIVIWCLLISAQWWMAVGKLLSHLGFCLLLMCTASKVIISKCVYLRLYM